MQLPTWLHCASNVVQGCRDMPHTPANVTTFLRAVKDQTSQIRYLPTWSIIPISSPAKRTLQQADEYAASTHDLVKLLLLHATGRRSILALKFRWKHYQSPLNLVPVVFSLSPTTDEEERSFVSPPQQHHHSGHAAVSLGPGRLRSGNVLKNFPAPSFPALVVLLQRTWELDGVFMRSHVLSVKAASHLYLGSPGEYTVPYAYT